MIKGKGLLGHLKLRISCEQTFLAALGYQASRPTDMALVELCFEGEYTSPPPLHPPLPLHNHPHHRGIPLPVLLSRCPPPLLPLHPLHPHLHHIPPLAGLAGCSGRAASIDSRDKFKKSAFQCSSLLHQRCHINTVSVWMRDHQRERMEK